MPVERHAQQSGGRRRFLRAFGFGDACGNKPVGKVAEKTDGGNDPAKGLVEGYGEGYDASGKSPDEHFASECLSPTRLGTAGRDARAQRRKKARDGSAVVAEGLALLGGECGLFAEDEAVIEKEEAEGHNEPARAAGEESDSGSKKHAAEIERIANMAERAVSDQAFGVKRVVMNDRAAKVRGSPGANQAAESAEKRREGENDVQSAKVGGRRRFGIDGMAQEQLHEGDRGVLMVEAIAEESQPENSSEEPEAGAEFDIGGAHHEISGPSTPPPTAGELRASE